MQTVTSTQDRPERSISPENLTLLQNEVYRDSGIVLDDSKLYLIEARLASILEDHQLTSLNDLCALLRATKSPSLRQEVVEAMTTNETLFFRDPPVYSALRRVVLPELLERREQTRTLSIWCAASSTGQEPYSVAMILVEMGLPAWNIRILGTDINSQVLRRAREGRYRQIEISRGLPPEYLQRHFERDGDEWQLSDQVRKMVEFRQFDLRGSSRHLGRFDLVLCRNVLIYFDVETKSAILRDIQNSLLEGGYLVLGCAETTLNLGTEYKKRVINQATFHQTP